MSDLRMTPADADHVLPRTYVDRGDGTYAEFISTSGGGGGGGTLSDVLLRDSTGQIFVYRDGGTGTPTAYAIPGWTSYTPVAPITVPLPNGASISAKQDTIIAAIGSPLQAGGAVSVSNLPATQAVSAASLPLPAGAATAANQATANTSLAAISGTSYKAVAASQTAVVLGATGATGDILNGLLITPLTTSPGAVSVQDGSGSAITVFTGGSSSVSSLVPFSAFLGAKSTSGAWKVTTGANVSVVGVGSFT
jgi:hypothetical protein